MSTKPELALIAAEGADGYHVERQIGFVLRKATHPDPAKALSDGPNAVPLKHMKALLETLLALDTVTKKNAFLEDTFQA